jgi:hypothetical protein
MMRDVWEHALTCPLPLSSSYELLQTLRLEVVKYLNWVTHDLVLVDMELALRELQRATDRLTRVTAMIPDAAEAAAKKYAREIEERSQGNL